MKDYGEDLRILLKDFYIFKFVSQIISFFINDNS